MRNPKRKDDRKGVDLAVDLIKRGERFYAAMVKAGYNQTSCAKALNLPIPTVNKLIHGKIKRSTFWPDISKLLNVNLDWLLHGYGQPKSEAYVEINQNGKVHRVNLNAKRPPFDLGTPLFRWDQVDIENIDIDSLPQKQYMRGGSKRTICLVIEDEFNLSPDMHIKSFHIGDIIHIDPEIQATDGAMVLAHIEGDDYFIFRKYIKMNNKWWLKPLNTQFPAIPLSHNIKIIGVYYATARYDDIYFDRRQRDAYIKKSNKKS